MRKKYPLSNLRGSNSYEFAEMREPGERIRTIGIVQIDRSIFQKSKKEKELLKLAKLQAKDEIRK